MRDEYQTKKKEEREEGPHWGETLLDNIPGCIALILKKNTREIVASNKAAWEIGAVPGKTCYETCANRDNECPFCLAPKLWSTGELQKREVKYQETYYQGIWAPLTETLYIHYIFDITESKLVEEALRKSEEQYRLLFNSMSEGFCVLEKVETKSEQPIDFLHVITNPAFAKQSGVGDAVGKTLRESYPGEAEVRFDIYNKVLQTGEPIRFEQEFNTLGRVIELYAYPIEDETNRYVGVIFQDITERKRKEEELKESEARFRILANSSPLMIWSHDKSGKLQFINKAYTEFFGLTIEDVSGNKWTNLVHPEDANNYFNTFLASLKEQKEFHAEARVKHVNGQWRWIESFSTPRFAPSGDFLGMTGTTLDITERKKMAQALQNAHDELEEKIIERTMELARANEILQQEINERLRTEKALQESEQRYRTLVNYATEAILVVQDELIKFANPEAERVFEEPIKQLKTVPFSDFVHPEDKPLISRRHIRLLRGEKVDNPFPFRLITGSGNTRLISKSSDLIEWEGRSAILSLMTDITEAKRIEEELMKEDKLDSIGILAGGIAHDFNNYLATLLGNISIAKLYTGDENKIFERLENMEKATIRAKDLSNQLFTFSRGGAPVKDKISIKQLIVDNIKFTLSGSKSRPGFNIEEDLYMVEADEGQLSQVLNNIAINAVQAMPNGGCLEVKAENIVPEAAQKNFIAHLSERPYIKIIIKDEGTGISEKYLNKIFDPFFTTKDKGRGLGLATAYSIIKNHGGHLQVESKMGHGTSFMIYLPAIAQTETCLIKRSEVYRGTGKILIMDDEEDLLTVTGDGLSALGYTVSLARDGKEAIEIYVNALKKGHPFNLVILDLTIPGGMGGKETITALLRKDPVAKAVVVSGYSNDPVMANYQDFGFMAAVKKPFTIEELSNVVKTFIQK